MSGNKKIFDVGQIKDDLLASVNVWQNNLQRVLASAGEKERAVVQKASERAAYVKAEVESGNWSATLGVEAMSSIERTLANEVENIDDLTIAEARKISFRSAVLGGIGMVIGVLGSIRR